MSKQKPHRVWWGCSTIRAELESTTKGLRVPCSSRVVEEPSNIAALPPALLDDMSTDLLMACDPEDGNNLLAHHNPRMKQVTNTVPTETIVSSIPDANASDLPLSSPGDTLASARKETYIRLRRYPSTEMRDMRNIADT